MCVRGRALCGDTHMYREVEAWLSQGCSILGRKRVNFTFFHGGLWGKKLGRNHFHLLARESCPRNSSILAVFVGRIRVTSSRILCHCRRFSDQSCGIRCLGVRNRATSTWRVRHGVVFLLAYEVPGLSFAARVGAGLTRSVNIR